MLRLFLVLLSFVTSIAGASNEMLSLQLQVVKDNANIKKGGAEQVKLVCQYACKLVITSELKFEIPTSLK